MPAKIARKRSFQFTPQLETLETRSLMTAGCLDLPTVPAAVQSPPSVEAAALVDDRYGQNDSLGTAANLGTITSSKTFGQLVQADANDYYRFALAAPTSSSDSLSITFQNLLGDLDLRLYDATGKQLQISQGVANTEQVSLANLKAGTYYVRVYGYRGETNPSYSLNIKLAGSKPTPAPTIVDDAYENNDTRLTARNLGTRTSITTIANLVLADSNDWYRFSTTSTGGSTAAVKIAFLNSQGNLALQLYSSSGVLLGSSNGAGNSESLSLAGKAAGTYYVRVYSANGATNPKYSLTINPATAITPPPVASTPTPAPSPTPAPYQPPTSGGFNIEIAYAGLTTSQRAIFERAASRWESIIVGDLPNATYNGRVVDDLLINASAASIDGTGGILGQAGPDRFRSGTQLPYHGNMRFDSADLAAMESNGTLYNVVVHEMGHVLGIGTLWATKGLLVGAGTSNPLYIGRQATAQYNALFGTSSGGVPVESEGGSGTRDAHWRDSLLGSEVMTGYINSGTNPLSRITVASLADMGYSVNIAAADSYVPGASSVQYVQASIPPQPTTPYRVYDSSVNLNGSNFMHDIHIHTEASHDHSTHDHDEEYDRRRFAAVDALFTEGSDFVSHSPSCSCSSCCPC